MNYADIFAAGSLVWPMTILLMFLVVLKQMRDDVRPIFHSIVSGLAANAQSNATAYAIAIGFGLSASFSAFWDVFNNLDASSLAVMSWHQYAALWTKVLNPFIVAVLAYATQNNFSGGGIPLGNKPPPA
jgi:hypothetical protein